MIAFLLAAACSPIYQEEAETEALPHAAIASLGDGKLKSGDPVWKLAVDPAGRFLASMHYRAGLRIWDRRTGLVVVHKEKFRYQDHELLHFSRDGKRLYLGTRGSLLSVDPATGAEVKKTGYSGSVVALSSENLKLVTYENDSTAPLLRVSEVATGVELFKIKCDDAFGLGAALSDDSTYLTRGQERDGILRLWNVNTGKEALRTKAHDGAIWSISFSPNARLVASAGADGTVGLWNLSTGTLSYRLRGHSDSVSSVAFSTDGSLLASGSYDHTIQIWEASTGKPLTTVRCPGEISAVAFSPNEKSIFAGTRVGSIHQWSSESGKAVVKSTGHFGQVLSLATSPDGVRLASSGADKSIRLWDTTTWTEIRSISEKQASTFSPGSLAFSPNGRIIAAAYGRDARLLDAASGSILHSFPGEDDFDSIEAVAFAPDGARIVAGSRKGVRLYDAVRGGEPKTLSQMTGDCPLVAYSPNGELVVSSTEDNAIRTWIAETGEEVPRFLVTHPSPSQQVNPPKAKILSLAFTPDSATLLASIEDGRVCRWEVSSRKEMEKLQTGATSVSALSISPSGSLAAGGDAQGLVNVWEIRSGRILKTLRGHVGPVSATTFLSDGRILASGGADSRILLWDVLPPVEINDPEVLWSHLAALDPYKAYSSVAGFIALGGRGAAILREKVRRIPEQTIRKVALMLESDDLAVRQEALSALTLTGEEAKPVLEDLICKASSTETCERLKAALDALASPSIKAPGRLRLLRAIEALEWMGTADAREVLSDLGKDRAGSLEAEIAVAAFSRSIRRQK